jgi:dGTPase
MGATIREQLEAVEARILSPLAAKSGQSRGRLRPEAECDLRPAFQHDRDRILHSKAFRRLKHKSQVFLSPTGDHYRTRLTHTLEVAQIARTMAKCLRLNEDLTEAIALGHDLGHTPFGHAGEAVLNQIVEGGFRHHEQSLRVVDILEGLNLTLEVRDGIFKHSKGLGEVLPADPSELAVTLEGQLVRVADIIAYICHDIDDALRAGVLNEADLPQDCCALVGRTHSSRIGSMVRDLVTTTLAAGDGALHLRPEMAQAMDDLRTFLFGHVYGHPSIRRDFDQIGRAHV